MSFFSKETTWTNTEFIPFKLCIASAYLCIGTYFNNFFSQYYLPLLILFGITIIWTMSLWIHKMKAENKN